MLRLLHFELLRHKRSKFQQILVSILSIVFMASLFIHWSNNKSLNESQAYWQKQNDELWRNQPDRHPHRVAHYGYVAIKPSSPLSFIDPGVEPYSGNYLFLEAHKQNSSSIQSSAISPSLLKLGFPSVANIFLFIWPLLLIAIGFGTFSDDWESEQLLLIASFGAKLRDLYFTKFIVYLLYTLLIVSCNFLVASLLLYLNETLNTENIAKLLYLSLLFIIYSGVWISIILSISFYSQTGFKSLTRLLAIWVLLTILIPKFSLELVKWQYPTAQRALFSAQVEEEVHSIGNSHNPEDPYFTEFKKAVLARYNVSTIEELPVNWNGVLMAEGERLTSEIFQKHYNKLLQQFSDQDRLYSIAGFISPYIAFKKAVLQLSNSDRQSDESFKAAAEKFRYQLIQQLNKLHSSEIKQKDDRQQKIDAHVWHDIPMFQFKASSSPLKSLSKMSLLFWLTFIALFMILFNRKKIL